MKYALLASSPTREGITTCINEFWCSTTYSVNETTLAIEHPVKVPEGVRVIKKAGRYRFERVVSEQR